MNNKKEQELYEKYKDLSQEVLNNIFLGACFQGDLEHVKFVLTYPGLKNHADIHINDYLKRKPNEQVENMFKIRDINKNLEKKLSLNKINKKKVKL